MFAGELKKQKALFAVADIAGLIIAALTAIKLHDPDNAMENQLQNADLNMVVAGAPSTCIASAMAA